MCAAVPAQWPDPEATVQALVPGLNTIAPLDIAYSRLPGRAKTAYAPRYRRWSDIADEPVGRVLTAPGAGDRTFRALLALAHETVQANSAAAHREQRSAQAAATELLDRLDAPDRTILTDLVFPSGPRPYEQVMTELGVNKAWFDRNRPRARARFTEMLTEPAHRDVIFHADQLRRDLGPLLPAEHLTACLARRDLDPGEPAALMLIYLAGPFTPRDDWWENSAQGGAHAMVGIVEHCFAHSPVLAIADLHEALGAAGMNRTVVPAFLDKYFPVRIHSDTILLWSRHSTLARIVEQAFDNSPTQTMENLSSALIAAGLPADLAPAFLDEFFPRKTFGDICVRWGPTSTHQLEGILHAHGTPMSVEEIYTHLDAPLPTMTTLMTNLSNNTRFARASKKTWALRAWNGPEYIGIGENVGRFLDEAGGKLTVADLVARMTTTFPDVTAISVRKFLSTLAFVNHKGTVRRRTKRDPWPTPPPLNTVRGAFRNGPDQIRLGVLVDVDVLRGSGAPLPAAFTAALGVKPAGRAEFTSTSGPVPITWQLASTHGPRLGSVRLLARAVGAAVGDTLVLAFDLSHSTLTPTRIPAGASPVEALAALTGLDSVTLAGLATSLDCASTRVAEVLAARGDTELADAARAIGVTVPR